MKYFLGVLAVGAVLGSLAFFNITPFRQAVQHVLGTASPVNSTFNSAKIAAVNMVPLTTAATTTYILNTDTTDRIVTDGFYACDKVGTSYSWGNAAPQPGIAALTLIAATTSANTGQPASANTAMMNVSVATATQQVNLATSSSNGLLSWAYRWPTNTYMAFSFNATNTAVCTVGVKYLGT